MNCSAKCRRWQIEKRHTVVGFLSVKIGNSLKNVVLLVMYGHLCTDFLSQMSAKLRKADNFPHTWMLERTKCLYYMMLLWII